MPNHANKRIIVNHIIGAHSQIKYCKDSRCSWYIIRISVEDVDETEGGREGPKEGRTRICI